VKSKLSNLRPLKVLNIVWEVLFFFKLGIIFFSDYQVSYFVFALVCKKYGL